MKYTLDWMLIHCRAPCTHTHSHQSQVTLANSPTGKVERNQKSLEETHVDKKRMHNTPHWQSLKNKIKSGTKVWGGSATHYQPLIDQRLLTWVGLHLIDFKAWSNTESLVRNQNHIMPYGSLWYKCTLTTIIHKNASAGIGKIRKKKSTQEI